MNNLTVIEHNGVPVTDSREVAEMVEKEHKDLLKSIRQYCDYLGQGNFAHSDFFIKSAYINSQNKEQPCYLITRKGCDMIAHKMTGRKGVLFTAAYVTKFEEMEKVIQQENITGISQRYFEAATVLSKTPNSRIGLVVSCYRAAGLTRIEYLNKRENEKEINGASKVYGFRTKLIEYISDPNNLFLEKYIIGQPFRNYIKAVYGESLTQKQFGDLMRAAGSDIEKINIYDKNGRTTRSVWRLPL
jgi:Rha family phage regulatory protein